MGDLLAYAYRVAGAVGLMMCHVLGVKNDDCLVHAAHLGMAMQLTNICRDVQEDHSRGRLYVPATLIDGQLETPFGAPLSRQDRDALKPAVRQLLAHADHLYASGAKGFVGLNGRVAFAISAAALIYRAIGQRIRSRGFDVGLGRAVVSFPAKLILVLKAAGSRLTEGRHSFFRRAFPSNGRASQLTAPPERELLYPRTYNCPNLTRETHLVNIQSGTVSSN